MTISLLIDVVILALLFGAITYGVILARRIARLQSALLDLAPALQDFCDAVTQSERSVLEIRRETDRFSKENERAREIRADGGANVLRAEPRHKPRATNVDRSDLVRMFFETAKARAR